MIIKANRRNFFRISFDNPVCARLTIRKAGTSRVLTGSAPVCIQDIGPDGLKFNSTLLFPVNDILLLEFTLNILDCRISLQGSIVRRNCKDNSLYSYGVQFTGIDEAKRSTLVRLFNHIQTRIRNGAYMDSPCLCGRVTHKQEYILENNILKKNLTACQKIIL